VRSYWWRDFVIGPLPGEYGFELMSIPSRLEAELWWDGQPLWVNGSIALTELWPEHVEPLAFTGLGFGVRHLPDRSIVFLPYWFLAIAMATSASLPWVSRCRWRFSLRTLLIATTLVAVVLGLIVYVSR